MFDALKKMIDRGSAQTPAFVASFPTSKEPDEGLVYVGLLHVSIRVDIMDVHGQVMTRFGSGNTPMVRWGVVGEIDDTEGGTTSLVYEAIGNAISTIKKDGVCFEEAGSVHWFPPHRILGVSVKKTKAEFLKKTEQFGYVHLRRESAPYSLSGDESVD